MSRSITLVVRIITLSFFLNLLWENAQAPLYAGYVGFWQHFPACFRGALGDVVITILLFGIFILGSRSGWWIESRDMWVATLLLVSAGILVAIGIEYGALVTGRWAYAAAMPLFPGTRAGLWPVAQMAILPSVTFYFSRRGLIRR